MTSSERDNERTRQRLPRGSHGLPPEFVRRSQRERLFAGLARVVARVGYAATSVDDIAAESHVSRKALYTHFTGKEDVLLQAHESVVRRIAAGAGPAIAEQEDWKSALRALLDWALEFFAREPAYAHLALVEMAAATKASRRAQRESLTGLRRLIERALRERGRTLPDAAIDGMLGGIVYAVAKTAEEGRPEDLPALRPALMAWFALVLEGEESAERELTDEVPISPL